jgi:hypothetical protein
MTAFDRVNREIGAALAIIFFISTLTAFAGAAWLLTHLL